MKTKVAINRRFKELEAAAEPLGNEVDRFSLLPDDILVSIFSRLPLQEATANSILSTRFRNLYTYVNHLRFPPLELNNKFSCSLRERQRAKISNYLNMIDHILDSYKFTGALEEFMVHMHCFQAANIDKWLEFASARQAEVIDIKMHYLFDTPDVGYTLQISNLIRMKGWQTLSGLKCLKKLSLLGIDVDDQEVENLISYFPLLEGLSIEYSMTLRNVSIVGHPMLKLKYLDISYATDLESIKISNTINLVSLRCYGRDSAYILSLNNVPKLTELSFSEHKDIRFADMVTRIPSYIRDQLRLLKLCFCSRHLRGDLPTYELINVRHVELEIDMRSNWSTIGIFPLIEACSSLEQLEIKFLRPRRIGIFVEFVSGEVLGTAYTKKLSSNLKSLMLLGYLGSISEHRLGVFVIRNAAGLQQLTVVPCNLTHELRRQAIHRARKHFLPITPKSVDLLMA